jgi:DNA-binding transcriptional ArsR family regulator
MQVQDNSDDLAHLIPPEIKPLLAMHAAVCTALANQHRLAIMYCLSQGEMSVGALARAVDISVHLVSQHLRVLKGQMLVRSRREAQTVYYSLANPKYIQACRLMCQALVEQQVEAGQTLLAADLLDRLATGALSEHGG